MRRSVQAGVVGLAVAMVACRVAPSPESSKQAGPEPGARSALALRIDSVVDLFMKNHHVPGISVAVVKRADTVVFKGYGFADLENQVPATPLTVYRIGSITKQFTAAGIMRLVEQGKIRLDAPLSTYLPEYPEPGRGATIRQLLTHTSGIPSYTSLGARFRDNIRLDLTDQQLVALFDHVPLDFIPGNQWRYDNSGYYLLGMIVARLSHTRYSDYIRDTLAGPLGLAATLYCSSAPIIPHRASGYSWDDGHSVNSSPLSMNIPGGAGALCSTVGDLVRWQGALAGGKVVTPASYVQMTTPVELFDGKHAPYGFGLDVGKYHGHSAISHSGGINGFSTDLAYYPAESLTVVVLTNVEGIDAARLTRQISLLALGIPQPAPLDLTLTDSARQRYIGRYSGPGLELEIKEQDGRLVLTDERQRLLYQGQNAFVLESDPEFVFRFDGSGPRATGCQVTRATGSPVDLTRVR
jgi:CubicO group peptidase (beta-lactamase class C family)